MIKQKTVSYDPGEAIVIVARLTALKDKLGKLGKITPKQLTSLFTAPEVEALKQAIEFYRQFALD